MRIKVLQFRHGRARLLPSRGVKKRFFFRHALILLGLALALMLPRLGWGLPSCTCARFNDWKDLGCHKPPGGAGFPDISQNGGQGNHSGCPTCPSPQPLAGPDASDTSASSAASTGMPRWWVDEPYINLHVVDEPFSYRTSSGQEMEFKFYYKQRFELPLTDQIPTRYNLSTDRAGEGGGYAYGMHGYAGGDYSSMTNAAWTHNWTMHILYWDAKWEANDFETINFADSYEALVFMPEGGIKYFTWNATNQNINAATQTTDPLSQIQLVSFPLGHPNLTNTPTADTNGIYWGSSTNGLALVYPDGSQDVFSLGWYAGGGTFHAPDTTTDALLTQRIDPQGRITRLGYEFVDSTNTCSAVQHFIYRLKYVVDSDGHTNTFVYAATV